MEGAWVFFRTSIVSFRTEISVRKKTFSNLNSFISNRNFGSKKNLERKVFFRTRAHLGTPRFKKKPGKARCEKKPGPRFEKKLGRRDGPSGRCEKIWKAGPSAVSIRKGGELARRDPVQRPKAARMGLFSNRASFISSRRSFIPNLAHPSLKKNL